MTASEFLREISKEQLTSREFLALIGRADISNEDYSEIKNNPSMTFERLAEILENSSVTGEDYENLIKTARQRKEIQAQKKRREELEQAQRRRREELENRLASALSGETEVESEEVVILAPAPAPVNGDAEEIDVGSLDEIGEIGAFELEGGDGGSAYKDTTVEDLWGDSGGFEVGSESDNDDGYGGGHDFDVSAHRENTPKVVICLVMGVVLFVLSFALRYMNTGSWGVSDFSYKGPRSYEEVFELVSKKGRREAVEPSALYRAGRFTEPLNPLSSVVASENFLFTAVDGSVCAVGIEAGVMNGAPSFAPDSSDDLEIVGMVERNNVLYVVCGESALSSALPRTAVYEFNALEFSGVPDNSYFMSGRFREVIARENGLFVVADYFPSGDAVLEETRGYVPYYGANGEENPVPLDNTEFIHAAEYCDATVIGSVSGGGGFEAYAVSGNSADCVYADGDSLIMSFYSKKKNVSQVVRYNVFGGVLNMSNSAWGVVSGMVGRGFVDGGSGSVRIVADLDGSAALYVFTDDMDFVARSGNVDTEGRVMGAAFDGKAAYIIAGDGEQSAKVYAIGTDGSKPAFLNEPDALISDKEFYAWGSDRFFSVEAETDADGNRVGIMVVMYRQEQHSDASPKRETEYRVSLPDATWNDYTHTSAEEHREAVAASRESGVIIFPVAYFNAVTRVESFIALDYSETQGFSEIGKITEIGFNTRNHAVVIRGGYIYTVWDKVVRSAATDLTMISGFEF